MSPSRSRFAEGLRWRGSARRLAGRYRRRRLRKGSPPLDLLRLARRHYRFARNVFLSLHRIEVVPRGGLSVTLAPIPVHLPADRVESSTLGRREARLERTRLRVETRLRPTLELHRHRRTANVIFRTLSISTDRLRSEDRRSFVSVFPEARVVAAEATRAGRRVRERLGRSEVRRAGATRILIEHSAPGVPVARQSASTPDDTRQIVDGTAPATWQAFGTQSLDVTRLTDEVLRQIDCRVVARRERFGRV